MSALFQGTRFLVVKAPNTPENSIKTLKTLISENGGSAIVAPASDADVLTKHEIHHILTADSNFAAATTASRLMIPTTSPEWAEESVEAKQKRNYRLYAPNPLPLMDKVVLCIADNIPSADRDAMYSAVREFGGQYLDALSRYTTHLVAEDLSNNKSLVASSIHRPDVEIKIVLPQWVGECMRRGYKVDETPYLLSDPVVLQTGQPNHDGEETGESVKSTALAGKKILLGSSYPISDYLRSSLDCLISRCGGEVVSEFSPSVDVFVCKYRSGDEYDKCRSAGIEAASLLWIFYVAVHGFVLPSESNLLHSPAPPQPLSKFQGLRISVTGYSGDARFYLAQLISLLGAEFTKTLDSNNDYLVCAKSAGDKYNAVKKRWPKVAVVNHLWVEECFSEWSFLDPSQKRYAEIGPSIPLGLTRLTKTAEKSDTAVREDDTGEDESHGDKTHEDKTHEVESHETKTHKDKSREHKTLDDDSREYETSKAILQSRPETQNDTQESNSQESQQFHDITDHQVSDQASATATALLVENGQLVQSSSEKPETVEMVDVTEVSLSPPVGRSSRSAKQKASAKLHSDMEDLNKYTSMSKSVRKMRTFMEELEQATPTKKRPLQSVEERNKKHKLEQEHENRKKEKKDLKKEQAHLVAIVTGCEQELTLHRADIVKLARIGISIVSDYNPKKVIDTIIAPRVLRTEKFLKSLSKASRIVHPTFLLDVLTRLRSAELSWNEISKEFNIDNYALDKVVSVKQINDELGVSGKSSGLQRLLAHENGLVFAGVRLNLSVNVNGGLELIASILEAHGLRECKQIKLSSATPKDKMLENGDGKTIVVAHKTKDKKVLSQISGFTAVDWDWCVKSIFNGQLQEYGKYALGK